MVNRAKSDMIVEGDCDTRADMACRDQDTQLAPHSLPHLVLETVPSRRIPFIRLPHETTRTNYVSFCKRIIMTKFFFDYPTLICIAQMAATSLALELLKLFKLLSIQPYTFERAKEMFLPSFLYTFSAYISMNAIEGISMPMFVPIECFCPLAILLFTSFVLRRSFPSTSFLCTIFIICLGSSTANVFQFEWERWSYLFGVAALVMQAASFVMIENLSQHYSALDLLYVNSFHSLALFLFADFFEDEIRDAVMFCLTNASVTFVIVFAVVVLLGILVQLSSFYCISYASSLVLAVTADVRSSLQVFISYLFSVYAFYDIIPGVSNAIGLLMTLGASIVLFRVNIQQLHKTSSILNC
ncbi:Solute carrier family 35 member D3 [Toxocara canis]|uniref:Solute carrier family 35 member D3 n=1 Tax=Toxocara canis TaxID=6265 RepID=A0A0B2VF34_TOXCA|nr:Solute carrier family 35 member D3 [Toxocara canis]